MMYYLVMESPILEKGVSQGNVVTYCRVLAPIMIAKLVCIGDLRADLLRDIPAGI